MRMSALPVSGMTMAGPVVDTRRDWSMTTVLLPAALPVMDRALLLPSTVLPCDTTRLALFTTTPMPLLVPLPVPVPRTWLAARVRLAPRETVAPLAPITSEPDSAAVGPEVPVPAMDSAVLPDWIVEASMTSAPPVIATPDRLPVRVLLDTRAVPPSMSSA